MGVKGHKSTTSKNAYIVAEALHCMFLMESEGKIWDLSKILVIFKSVSDAYLR
jgi:hypothetical protein